MKLSRSPSQAAPARIPCVIVEDDAASRMILEKLISQEADLELVASIAHGDEAYSFLLVNPHVRILFLDIQVPGRTGIELLEALPRDGYMHTILVTMSSDFAVDAYNLSAVDYLVKPFSSERFKEAVDKVRRLVAAQQTGGQPSRELYLKSGNKLVRVQTQEIVYLEASEDTVQIHMKAGEPLSVSITLRDLEARLAPLGFMRVHRSYVINMSHIDQVGDHTVQVKGTDIPVSKSHQEELFKRLRAFM